jgi:D-alanyl-D-alanine dipeptidase
LRSGNLAATTLVLMVRPWRDCPIRDCGEPLLPLEPALLCLRPHPYVSLGAPYGPGSDPFRLRQGVRQRLLLAQDELQRLQPSLRLGIFDAWRPVVVQSFMVEHAFLEECRRRQLDANQPSQASRHEEVRQLVERFWAPPSSDPTTPPPHSTGAAVDLTLVSEAGMPLDMGGEIDAIGSVSEPDFYSELAHRNPDSAEAVWHERRELLASCLSVAGFVRHPNEWWHFSYGDQLWAWRTAAAEAVYGRSD